MSGAGRCWGDLANEAPALAAIGTGLLYRANQAEVAMLATVDGQGSLQAIPFPSFDPTDPIYEFLIDRACSVSWVEGERIVLGWPG